MSLYLLIPLAFDPAALMAQNPEMYAALQSQLGGLVGQSSGYIESLPKCVHRRINALERLQVAHSELDAKFQEEVLALEKKYHQLHQPLYNKVCFIHVVNF